MANDSTRRHLCRGGTAAAVVFLVLAGAAQAEDESATTRSEGESSIAVIAGAYGSEVTTVNTTFQVTGDFIPGLPKDARVVLRQRVETVQVVGDKGAVSTTVSAEAWRLGDDLAGPPRWVVTAPGDGAEVFGGEFYVVWGENTDWPYPPKTAYRLADGARLFAATVPWTTAQVEGPDGGIRHAAYATAQAEEVAADVAGRPFAVGLITYTTALDVLQRVVVAADTEERGYEVRAVEETPSIAMLDGSGAVLPDFAMIEPAGRSGLAVVVRYPFNGLAVTIPIVDDRLAVDQADVPAVLRLVPLP